MTTAYCAVAKFARSINPKILAVNIVNSAIPPTPREPEMTRFMEAVVVPESWTYGDALTRARLLSARRDTE